MDETNALLQEILTDRENFADAICLYIRGLNSILRVENLKLVEPPKPRDGFDGTDEILKTIVDMRESGSKSFISTLGTVCQKSSADEFVVTLRLREVARYLEQLDNGRRLLSPVVTIVLYFGAEPWTAPRSLKELVGFDELPHKKDIEPFFNDYKLNLVDFHDVTLEEIHPMRSDFKFYATLRYNLFHPEDAVELPGVKNTELALRFLRRFEGGTNAVKISSERLSQGGYGMDALFTDRIVYE